MIGKKIYNLAKLIWPIHRSLTGKGNRETLKIFKKICNKLKIIEIKSGKKVFDWKIPKEWAVSEAWIKDKNNKKIIDFKNNNLHLLAYSRAVKAKINSNDLKKKLYSDPEKPKAIPYVTSYYRKRWGFCVSENFKKKLKKGNYNVLINSRFFNGSMTLGEIYLPGKSKKEIFFSTYICHPAMGNNEISGPVTTIHVAKWLSELRNRNFSYRIVFIPETIGSIAYIHKNIKKLKKNVVAGFNITCVGDNRCYSYLPSRDGNTLSDKVLKHVLKWTDKNYKSYTWLDRGSDERQYCAPGVDLPVASIIRSKYGTYKEYHTSEDNLKNVVTEKGLSNSYVLIKKIIESLEKNVIPKTKILCEPMLSKRKLYPDINYRGQKSLETKLLNNVLTYCDGKNDLIEIAELNKVPVWKLYKIMEVLKKEKIVKIINVRK